jgi:hypothetical protein
MRAGSANLAGSGNRAMTPYSKNSVYTLLQNESCAAVAGKIREHFF